MSALPVLKNIEILPNGNVMGEVYNDKRFVDGDIICTTQIQELRTKNTTYLVEFGERK
jgi:hypothetical protein